MAHARFSKMEEGKRVEGGCSSVPVLVAVPLNSPTALG